MTRRRHLGRRCSVGLVVLVLATAVGEAVSAVTILPANNGRLGGTLVDGGFYGPFDGVADQWDWTFNGVGGFEGVLTLSPSAMPGPLEQRVVWEFDVSGLSPAEPLTATLSFSLRGPPIYPFPDVVLQIYAYPADLQEQPSDFNAEPAELVGAVVIAPFEEKSYQLNITERVVDALRSDGGRLGLRFQVAAQSPSGEAQAFMDAVDSDDATKPQLIILDSPLGDDDGDGVLDLDDFVAMPSCLVGPNVPVDGTCKIYDFDLDGDVDIADAARFIAAHSLFSPQ